MMHGKVIAAIVGAALMVAAGVWAQSSGIPSRPRFQALGVGVVAPAAVGHVEAVQFHGSGAGLTDLNASQLTAGTVPADRLPDRLMVQAADLVSTSLNPLLDTDFSFSVQAGGWYAIETFIRVNLGAGTGRLEWQVLPSGSAVGMLCTMRSVSGGQVAPESRYVLAGAGMADTQSGARVYTCMGYVQAVADAAVKLQFSQASGNAQPSTFQAGSWMRVRRVN